MNTELIEWLKADFERHPVLVAGRAEERKIEEIATYAGFDLPDDYVIFVKEFGAAIVGAFSVYGFGASDAMGDEEASVIKMTERYRKDKWPETEDRLVISQDHSGNAITLASDGKIYMFDHDFGNSECIATSFEGFLLNNLRSRS